MESYSISFKGMANGGITLDVTPAELDHLLARNLVRIQGEKIRSVVIDELAKYHAPKTELYRQERQPDGTK